MTMLKRIVGIVENDPGLLKALERLLTAYDFIVRPYVSAEAFLASAAVDEMTCLVLDIHLGGISGIQLKRRLAATGCTAPTIFMTARDSPDTHREAMEVGCVACLVKPFTASSLVDAIEQGRRSCVQQPYN